MFDIFKKTEEDKVEGEEREEGVLHPQAQP